MSVSLCVGVRAHQWWLSHSRAALLLLSIPTFGTDLASFITWAWLGGLNSFLLGSLWYARYSMQSLDQDIRKLESLRYSYKRL